MKIERRVKEGSWLPTRYAPTSYTYSPTSGSAHLKPDMKLKILNSKFLTAFQRESVANSTPAATGREHAVANAADLPLDEVDGWFKISPFGIFNGRQPGRPQHFGQPQAEAIEQEFNSLRGRLGRMFRGIPIYRGHPDVDPEVWSDDRRLGKIVDLSVRADGLWGLPEWNSLGRENQAEEFWVFPSPRWDAPQGKARFEPDRLISIGLTNTPRIKESEPIFNSEQPTNNTTDMDRTALCQALGLPPEATDEEILAKITSMQSAAADAETKMTEANTARTTAETAMADEKRLKEEAENSLAAARAEANRLREAHNNSLLDAAERGGRITRAERAGWQTKLQGDKREDAVNSLGALRPKLNTTGINVGAERRVERQEADGLREQVLNSISEAKRGGMKHDDAWAAARKNPAYAAYFDSTGI